MHIIIDWSISPEQKIDFITRISPACVLLEERFDLPERQHKIIEVLPTDNSFKQHDTKSFNIQITAYDLEKMRLIKQRIQFIKELLTTYTSLKVDRASCVKSSISSISYTIPGTYNQWNIVRGKQLSALEFFYIRWYNILFTLCLWRSKTMMSSVVWDWEPLLWSKSEKVIQKRKSMVG